MFLHFGQHQYGKVDVVPGLCYVVTRFIHINFVPLIPLASEIVVIGVKNGSNSQRVKTSLSLKSVLMAWTRAFLYFEVVATFCLGVLLTVDHFQRRHGPTTTDIEIIWGVAAGSLVFLWLTYRLSRAGYDRAHQLGAELGLGREFMEKHLTVAKEDREAANEAVKEPEGWERYR
jgi:hypothetical protein